MPIQPWISALAILTLREQTRFQNSMHPRHKVFVALKAEQEMTELIDMYVYGAQ